MRLDAEESKKIRGDTPAIESFRLAHSSQIEAALNDRGHSFKDGVLIAPINKVGW